MESGFLRKRYPGALDAHPALTWGGVCSAQVSGHRPLQNHLSRQLPDAERDFLIDNRGPRLSPFGMLICTVVDYGYLLLREPHES